MSPDETREVLEELRDNLEDERVELLESYEVWVLPEPALDLRRDARFARRFHHQVRTSSGIVYARSSVCEHGELDLDEIGNRPTAERIEAAAACLSRGTLRLLLVPSRQVIALWNPEQAELAVALSATASLAPGATLQEPTFEALLGQVPREIVAEIPPDLVEELRLQDRDAWSLLSVASARYGKLELPHMHSAGSATRIVAIQVRGPACT
jgi:hypothetical protein